MYTCAIPSHECNRSGRAQTTWSVHVWSGTMHHSSLQRAISYLNQSFFFFFYVYCSTSLCKLSLLTVLQQPSSLLHAKGNGCLDALLSQSDLFLGTRMLVSVTEADEIDLDQTVMWRRKWMRSRGAEAMKREGAVPKYKNNLFLHMGQKSRDDLFNTGCYPSCPPSSSLLHLPLGKEWETGDWRNRLYLALVTKYTVVL